MSHDVVTWDVKHNVSTVYCWSTTGNEVDRFCGTSRPHCLMKTSSVQLKRHRETNENILLLLSLYHND